MDDSIIFKQGWTIYRNLDGTVIIETEMGLFLYKLGLDHLFRNWFGLFYRSWDGNTNIGIYLYRSLIGIFISEIKWDYSFRNQDELFI